MEVRDCTFPLKGHRVADRTCLQAADTFVAPLEGSQYLPSGAFKEQEFAHRYDAELPRGLTARPPGASPRASASSAPGAARSPFPP